MFKSMRYTLLGVELNPITQAAAEKLIKQWLDEQPNHPKIVFTPNPEIIVYAQSRVNYRTLLNRGDLNVADGIGLIWLSQKQLPERITGTDLLTTVIQEGKARQLKIGVVLKPTGLSVTHDLPGMITTYDRFSQTPDIIIVAVGFPEQENWVNDHRSELVGCRLIMTVGGGIDFVTGKQRRAPLLFRRLGLEWLWRLGRQPWRWRRIITATIVFPYLVLKQRWFHV